MRWDVEQIVHFEPEDWPGGGIKDGQVHFGFHDRAGHRYALQHQLHFLGRLAENDRLEWTVASGRVFQGVPNIEAELSYPAYVDVLPDETLVVSNFGNGRLYRIDVERMTAELLVDGPKLGLVDMGHCVVDDSGCVWVNEVRGCRVWRFDGAGRPLETLGDGTPGYEAEPTSFDTVRFSWIYDLRRGPDARIYVLDSRNYALRVIDPAERVVRPLAGTGVPGYSGDGGDAREATLGGDPTAQFDGPFSLSVDEEGNAFVGDRYNCVVRMVDVAGTITTIAGRRDADPERTNEPAERDPLQLNLPLISSMDYARGRLYVPTDLASDAGDLAVLRRL
jgi:hypothetical protein